MIPEPVSVRPLRPLLLTGPTRTAGLLLLLGPVLTGSSAPPALSQEQPVVLRGARLLTISGGTVEDGILVERDGREEAIRGVDRMVLCMGRRPADDLSDKIGDQVGEVHVIGDAKEARRLCEAID